MSGIVGKNLGRGSGIVTAAPVGADTVSGASIVDDAVDSEHYAAGSIDLEHISSESVDEDNLHISNSGSNGNFLSKQSGDTGGLTWAAVTTDLSGDSSPQLGGFLDANGNYIQMQKGGDISSASPTVIDTDGDFFAVTGTTNFSAFTVAADRHFFLEFGAVLTMTHGNGTLDLPGAANITTAASDVGEFVSTAANVVTCVNYTKRDGTAIVLADNSITLAKMAGGTDGQIITYDASGDPVAVGPGTDGQVLTSTGSGSPPAFEAAAGGHIVGARAYVGSGQLIADSTTVLVQLSTESYDPNSDFTNTTTYDYTAPETGKYAAFCAFFIDAGSTTGYFSPSFYVDGTLVSSNRMRPALASNFSSTHADILDLSSGDKVDVRVIHNMGSSIDISASETVSFFAIQRVG
jgi:hypothetical protein